MSENTVKRHYFEPGSSLHTLAPGNEMRIPALLKANFNTAVVARDNWLELAGDAEQVSRAMNFLSSLDRLYKLRNRQLDLRDIELLARNSYPLKNFPLPTISRTKRSWAFISVDSI